MSWWLIYCEPGVLRRQPLWRQDSWEKATRNNSPSLSVSKKHFLLTIDPIMNGWLTNI